MIKNNISPKKSVIDYSSELIGCNIIERGKIPEILPKIAKFRHHKEERHKKIYLHKIKREIKVSNLTSLLLKQKIMHIKDNLIMFAEIINFVKNHDNCIIFMSVDNNRFKAFTNLLDMIPTRII